MHLADTADCRPFLEARILTAENQAEAVESDADDGFLLGSRPFGFEVDPVQDGRGAVISHVQGLAARVGLEIGSRVTTINGEPTQGLLTTEIQARLDEEPLPVTLEVRSLLSLPTVPQQKVRRNPVTVCTAHCRGSYKVVREAIQKLGWREVLAETRDAASVMWLEHNDSTEGLAPVQTMSRLEAFLSYCKKARLAQSLNPWVEELPEEFGFAPRTWVLPTEAEALEAAMGRGKDTYIAKPSAGSQGKGIILARKWKDLSDVVHKCKLMEELGRGRNPEQYVVQRYISDPLLLDNLKFDLRLYVVVTSIVPMRAYLFKEGLGRFCTKPYTAPKEGNLHEARMHLTNFAINKKSLEFQASEDLAHHAEGSKRSASAVLRQIEEAYGAKPEDIWNKVAELAANTLMALRPGLVEFYAQECKAMLHPVGPKGFQLIGLDILIDAALQPQLLELNANASLSAVQPTKGEPSAEAATDAAIPTPRPTVARGSAARRSQSLHRQARQRLGLVAERAASTERKIVTSELDLEVKRELVAQALLLSKPASQAKMARLRGQWARSNRHSQETIPLDDGGEWVPTTKPPPRFEALRTDAPEKCPAFQTLDVDELVAPDVMEYAKAHLAAYRCWCKLCGPSQDLLGPASMLKLLERRGFVGPGAVFHDKVAAQLWLTKEFRESAEGAFGLSLPQFVRTVGHVGKLLLQDGTGGEPEEDEPPSHITCFLESSRRGLLSLE